MASTAYSFIHSAFQIILFSQSFPWFCFYDLSFQILNTTYTYILSSVTIFYSLYGALVLFVYGCNYSFPMYSFMVFDLYNGRVVSVPDLPCKVLGSSPIGVETTWGLTSFYYTRRLTGCLWLSLISDACTEIDNKEIGQLN